MTRRGLTILLFAVAVTALATPVLAQTISLTATPTSLKFTYQAGAALPSAQTLSIRAAGGTPTFNVTVTDPANPLQIPLWLTVTPESGKTPASLSVRVNPTGMAVGVYGAVISVQVPGGPLAAVPVSLTVSQPLPTLNLSKNMISITAPPLTATDTVTLTTTAGPVSFTASAAGVSWLSVSPVNGYALPGAPITLTLSVDASLLSPQAAPYVGKITVVASGVAPANRSQTITVNLTVNSAPPTITAALWPNTAQVGSPATTVTIRGAGFYKATTVKVTPQGSTTATTVNPTVLSGTAMMAVIPASLLNTAQVLNVVASNPSGDSPPATFTVSSTPVVQAAVNLASYAVGPVSPGGLITLFGGGIGPITDAFMADADANGFVDTTLNGITVMIDGKDAPMIYVSHDQISVQVPYEVTTGTGKTINVTNGGTVATGTVDIAAASPGIFTLDTSGIGQAAALNYVAATATYTINSANNPAKIGDTVILYITGEGDFATTITPRTGLLIPPTLTPLPQLNPLPTVTIGGATATVAYAGPFVGSILGIAQLNVVVPSGSTTGPAVPVSVTIGGASTQSGVTLSIHP
jgi:uncharacterized protein (TIGR03437 family)